MVEDPIGCRCYQAESSTGFGLGLKKSWCWLRKAELPLDWGSRGDFCHLSIGSPWEYTDNDIKPQIDGPMPAFSPSPSIYLSIRLIFHVGVANIVEIKISLGCSTEKTEKLHVSWFSALLHNLKMELSYLLMIKCPWSFCVWYNEKMVVLSLSTPFHMFPSLSTITWNIFYQ